MKDTKRYTDRDHHKSGNKSRAERARVPKDSKVPDLEAINAAEPFVRKVANLEREETGDGSDIFEFVKVSGRFGECSIPRDKALDVKHVKAALQLKNASLPRSSGASTKMVDDAINQEPNEFRLQVATAGWRRNEKGFVSLDRVITFGHAAISICPPPQSFVSSVRLGCRENWEREVAGVAKYSTVATLLLSSAFAAPLLSILGRSSFLLNVFGASKSGKTTALLLAGAIIGLREENALPNWNSTDAGLLQLFRIFNDSIVPVNELALKGRQTDRSERVREMIYAFGDGRDRLRHSESSYAGSGNGSTFKGILLSTSEVSFSKLRGSARDDGELARAHDVPALIRGSTTIFDRLPQSLSSRQTRKKLNEFRQAITQNSAVVFDCYIKWLADREDVVQKAQGHIETFLKRLSLPPDDGVLTHAAGNFGVCVAGAALAIETGILPWDLGMTLSTIVTAFEEFRNVSGRPLDVRLKAKKLLRTKLNELNLSMVTSIKERPDDGVILKDGAKRTVVIRSTRFDEFFETEALAREVLVALDDAGHLRKAKGAGPATTANKKWAETFVKLPGGKGSFRAIQFTDFRKKKKTKNETKNTPGA